MTIFQQYKQHDDIEDKYKMRYYLKKFIHKASNVFLL